MTTYTYSETTLDKLVRRTRRWLVCVRVVASTALVLALWLIFQLDQTSHEHQALMTVAVLSALTLLKSVGKQTRTDNLRWRLRNVCVALTDVDVQVTYATGATRTIELSEVTKMERAKIGGFLYLRTRKRYRWLAVPGSLDEFASIQQELSERGIPMATRTIPANLEEWIFVLLFCVTVLANLFIRNVQFSVVNLLAALLVSGAGLYVVQANPESQFPKWKVLLGCCIPVLFAAVALVITLHR